MIYDYCIIGGGIVGLATATKLLEQHPGSSLLLLEKEQQVGTHQTGHNSGVIHAGIYYEPGSLKARLCREGAQATMDFCNRHAIHFEQCGKLIVATNATEQARLDSLYQRATANSVDVSPVSAAELREREPHINGVGAILSPSTGIVDYGLVARVMAAEIRAAGGEIIVGVNVERIVESPSHVEIGDQATDWKARRLIVCGGLQADRLARMAGIKTDFHIVPFRGEYYQLPADKNQIINHLIYPVPDPAMPFLGIHLTRMIDGSVTVGPNAVLGLAREKYAKASFSAGDTFDFATFPGFWKLIFRQRKYALGEFYRSKWKPGYLSEVVKYCPELQLSDLLPYRAGIRAQAVNADGVLVHDFLFARTARTLHVCNAPSPAATAALPIGATIAEKCTELD